MPVVPVVPLVPVEGVVEVPVVPDVVVPLDDFDNCCLNGSFLKKAGSQVFPVLAKLLAVPETELLLLDCDGGLVLRVVPVVPLVPEGLVSAFEDVAGVVSSPPQETARDTESITSRIAATAASKGEPLKFSNFLTITFISYTVSLLQVIPKPRSC